MRLDAIPIALGPMQALSVRRRFRPRMAIGEVAGVARRRGWVSPREAADVIGCPVKFILELWNDGLLKAHAPTDFSVLQIEFESLAHFVERFCGPQGRKRRGMRWV